ncbi:MAG: hypothetical protein K6F69_01025 [Treponema sp.]|nr:hypothetical protein [Treponema sp.]
MKLKRSVFRLIVSFSVALFLMLGSTFTSYAKTNYPSTIFDEYVSDWGAEDDIDIMIYLSANGILAWAKYYGYPTEVKTVKNSKDIWIYVYMPDKLNIITSQEDPISDAIKNTKESAKSGFLNGFLSGDAWKEGIAKGFAQAEENGSGILGILGNGLKEGAKNAGKEGLKEAGKSAGKAAVDGAANVYGKKNSGTGVKKQYAKQLNCYHFSYDTDPEHADLLIKYQLANNREDIEYDYYNNSEIYDTWVTTQNQVRNIYYSLIDTAYIVGPIYKTSSETPLYTDYNVPVYMTCYINDFGYADTYLAWFK